MKTGIDAISFDVAKIHLPIQTLAKARNIEPEKLEKGLGLIKMTFPDTHQDTVVFGANAMTKLISKNNRSEVGQNTIGMALLGFGGGITVVSVIRLLKNKK